MDCKHTGVRSITDYKYVGQQLFKLKEIYRNTLDDLQRRLESWICFLSILNLLVNPLTNVLCNGSAINLGSRHLEGSAGEGFRLKSVWVCERKEGGGGASGGYS